MFCARPSVFAAVLLLACGTAPVQRPGAARATQAPVMAAEPAPPVPQPKTPAVRGRVLDSAGQPVAGALVNSVAARLRHPELVLTTDADGRFEVELQPGTYAWNASHASGYAHLEPAAVAEDVVLQLVLDSDAVRARVTSGLEFVADRILWISPQRKNSGELYAHRVASDGTLSGPLPRASSYGARVDPSLRASAELREPHLEITVAPYGPPPSEVVTWIRDNARALTTTEPGHGYEDLRPLGAWLSRARIVGAGEATHGTREFFQLKHRVLEYLVAEQGFTLFGIEANVTGCRSIDAYVATGEGDARSALAALDYWMWNTEEVLALIEWMRAWNADPAHRTKLRFVGVDVEPSTATLAALQSYLQRVAPEEVDTLLSPLQIFGRESIWKEYKAARRDETSALRTAIVTLRERAAAQASAWKKRSSAAKFEAALDDVSALAQAHKLLAAYGDADGGDGASSFEVRDLAMAENALRAVDRTGGRMLLWAHNGHVAKRTAAPVNMGSQLTARLGQRYLTIGFVFGQGGVQVVDPSIRMLQERVLGPAPEWTLAAAFAPAGALTMLDLRLPPKPIAAWFEHDRPRREFGQSYTPGAEYEYEALGRQFDVVLYVNDTTRARPLEHSE